MNACGKWCLDRPTVVGRALLAVGSGLALIGVFWGAITIESITEADVNECHNLCEVNDVNSTICDRAREVLDVSTEKVEGAMIGAAIGFFFVVIGSIANMKNVFMNAEERKEWCSKKACDAFLSDYSWVFSGSGTILTFFSNFIAVLAAETTLFEIRFYSHLFDDSSPCTEHPFGISKAGSSALGAIITWGLGGLFILIGILARSFEDTPSRASLSASKALKDATAAREAAHTAYELAVAVRGALSEDHTSATSGEAAAAAAASPSLFAGPLAKAGMAVDGAKKAEDAAVAAETSVQAVLDEVGPPPEPSAH